MEGGGAQASHHWDGYDISLLAARARRVRRSAGLATVVVYKLAVTNTGRQPVAFNHQATEIFLNVPVGGGEVRTARDLASSVTIHGFKPLTNSRPLAPGVPRVGWVRFLVPSGAVSQLNNTLASISFLPAAWQSRRGLPHLGDIRLWSPATPQGAAAIHIREA